MHKYTEWAIEELCKSEKEILMTMGKIRKERKDDDENRLDSDQLDDLKDCLEGICHIYKTRAIVHAHHGVMLHKGVSEQVVNS